MPALRAPRRGALRPEPRRGWGHGEWSRRANPPRLPRWLRAQVAALKEKREAGLGCAQAREAGCSCLLVRPLPAPQPAPPHSTRPSPIIGSPPCPPPPPSDPRPPPRDEAPRPRPPPLCVCCVLGQGGRVQRQGGLRGRLPVPGRRGRWLRLEGAAGRTGRPAPCPRTPPRPPAPVTPRAQAGPTHSGAPPEQLDGSPWPQQPASRRLKCEGFQLSTAQEGGQEGRLQVHREEPGARARPPPRPTAAVSQTPVSLCGTGTVWSAVALPRRQVHQVLTPAGSRARTPAGPQAAHSILCMW